MEAKSYDVASFHSCLYCHGVWIPKDTIDYLYKRKINPDGSFDISAILQESKVATHSVNCPSCIETPLKTINTHEVELEACDKCSGIFFDSGEVESLFGDDALEIENNPSIAKVLTVEGLLILLFGLLAR
jgi:Zn-finger nucleic acid-binding protein